MRIIFNPITGQLDYVGSGSSPGPGPTNDYNVNVFTLTPQNAINKYVVLSIAPVYPFNTILNIIGGSIQDYGQDFVILSGNHLSWSGLGLDGVLVAGDKLVVQFI